MIVYDGIPQSLKDIHAWVVCNSEKKPINPKNNTLLKWENAGERKKFEVIKPWLETGFDLWPGFIFDINMDMVFIDFDKTFDTPFKANEEAEQMVVSTSTYAEFSKSGKGYHVIAKLSPEMKEWFRERGSIKGNGIEIYTDGRNCVFTGVKMPFSQDDVHEIPRNVLFKLIERASQQSAADIRKDALDRKTYGPKFDLPLAIPEGSRYNKLTGYGASLSARGTPYVKILEMVWEANTTRCKPPLPDTEMESQIKSFIKNVVDQDAKRERIKAKIEHEIKPVIPIKHNIESHNPKFELKLEETNWVSMFFNHYTKNKAPYPDYFHASALCLLSIAVKRRVYLETATRDIYPNIWSMLIGSSTISHKSEALSTPTLWARTMFGDTELSGNWSAAGLFQELEERPKGYMIKDEAASILNTINNNKETAAARDLLMQVYDNDPLIRKRLSNRQKGSQSEWVIKDAYTSFLWATTPENFSQNTTQLDINSGWLIRFLYYYPNYKKKPVPFSFRNGEHIEGERKIIDRFKEILKVFEQHPSISIRLSPDAEREFTAWQISTEERIQENENNIEARIFGRLLVVALKLAMLYTIASEEFLSHNFLKQLSISEDHIKEAIREVDEYFLPHAKIIIEMVERDTTLNIQDKIIGVLKASGGCCERSKLMQRVHIKKKELDEHLDTLKESKEILVKQEITIGENGQEYHKDIIHLLIL